ncbi:hypothetical protein C8R47DRAFT_6962 [Mycena vitilis]|nr:hypothetical protein C8R47DRAFT_6962 [Mycena vitilis]
MQPVALPALVPGVVAVMLHPELRVGDAIQRGIEFGSWVEKAAGTRPWMEESATSPGLPSLTVVSPCLPWPITVHGSGPCVLVEDIIRGIDRALGIDLTEEEVDEWMALQGESHRTFQMGSIFMARKRRKTHRNVMMTRLALLNGRTRFAGLSDSPIGCDVWVMHVA